MSASAYPEHLNPFHEDSKKKSSLNIRDSFREFTRTLRRSFRVKKRDKNENVEIRQKIPVNQNPIKIVSYPVGNESLTPLPRSRFKERLSKRQTIQYNSENHQISNPFDDNQNKLTIGRRKRKKRAPLPPNKSVSSQNINEEGLNTDNKSHSKWSLTSADTDYSCSTNISSVNNHDHDFNQEEMKEEFENFNEEMKKLNEEDCKIDENEESIIISNNNNNNNINAPDIIVSCSNDEKDVKIDKEKIDTKDNDNNNNSNVISDIKVINKMENLDISNNTNDDIPKKDENEVFLYYERKSLFIVGSSDDLNNSTSYTERCSLYITDSKENIHNNLDEEDEIRMIDSSLENVASSPTPKHRKNKLSTNVLLGKANDCDN